MAKLVALKAIGKYEAGEEFEVSDNQAKILVAIKKARYQTRDMIAEQQPIKVELSEPVQEERVKRVYIRRNLQVKEST